jgi:transposase-like protein
MSMKSGTRSATEKVVQDIRRRTRRQHSSEEKSASCWKLCRREGIAQSLCYSWSKEFLKAGKKRLAGDTARQATSSEVKDLRAEAATLKEAVADLTLENQLIKKACSELGRRRMRYPALEKLAIIRLVERSHLPTKRTLEKLGIPRTTFYRWYDRYPALGEAGLEDRRPQPGRVWNRIPDAVRRQIVARRLRSRSCRRGNWRCGSPIRSATSSGRPASTDCCERTT